MASLDQILRPITFALLLAALSFTSGCGDDLDAVREIKTRRQEKIQANSKQDHIGETCNYLTRIVELNRKSADRQIVYHLNQWRDARSDAKLDSVAPLVESIEDLLTDEQLEKRIRKDRFTTTDVDHLRDCYLFSQVVRWVNSENNDDPLIQDWLKSNAKNLSDEEADHLRTACRIFDWVVRNISYEQEVLSGMSPPGWDMPHDMELNGAGYRQSDYQTIWRGTGDWLQRAGVFCQLCRQANVPAAILATQSAETGEVKPWCVGVLIGKEIYLFDTNLGTYVPGPDQVGIATLSQARREAAITRRLGVAGFDEFEAPVSKQEIQQCIALLNLAPEAISPRMKLLESGLTGDRRMNVFEEVDQIGRSWDDAPGIAGVQIWKMPILAEFYAEEMEKQCELDPRFLLWFSLRWAILDSGDTTAKQLSKARWAHLHGRFADSEDEMLPGARTLYLGQRAPEFEIEDLAIDVDLQKKYFRRELGLSPDQYRKQLAQVQMMMRMGKRTASYWLSLVQYDDGRIQTASNWFNNRVLAEDQTSFWQPAARYNLARTIERLGDPDRAIELYKTSGDPQEHGNRIRARLVAKAASARQDE